MHHKSGYACSICRDEIIPLTLGVLSQNIAEHIHATRTSSPGSPVEMRTPSKMRSPKSPLLEKGSLANERSPLYVNSMSYRLLQQLLHTLTDSLRNQAVYYHLAGTTPIYYCQNCGTKLNAKYIYYGLDMEQKILQNMPPTSFQTPVRQAQGLSNQGHNAGNWDAEDSPLLQWDKNPLNSSPSPRPPLQRILFPAAGDTLRQRVSPDRRKKVSPTSNFGSPITSSSPRNSAYTSQDASMSYSSSDTSSSSTSTVNSSNISDISAADLNTYGDNDGEENRLLYDTINQHAFHRYKPEGTQKKEVMHNILLMLSKTYRQLQHKAEDNKTDIREQISADLGWTNLRGWLSTFGIKTYPHLQTIAAEAKQTIEQLEKDLPLNDCPALNQHCPALWSMQHITPRGVELAMIDVSTSWKSYLAPTQRTRFIVVMLIVILLILMIIKPEWFELRAPESSGGAHHDSSTTTTPHTTPHTTPNPSPQPPSPPPQPPSPPPQPPSPPPQPPSPPPQPPSPPTGPNCTISSTCETSTSPHWQVFTQVMQYNANLSDPITNMAQLFSECGATVQTAFMTIYQSCTQQDPVVLRMLNNAATTSCVAFAEYLQKNW